ncbi:unnamed protein product (mitochondrion) [Plasmodiophora brassicae]|uniref:3-oxo-5-alpha-steroid 4-dehydrogenase C-terminal domain-containing protein n=2 Tax=Plasmodiophora brassicae TaxID=37360 RepID=A0A3P3YJJ2_PLABS|nr:unnamed protein product [Plasmodiophora brassicae]
MAMMMMAGVAWQDCVAGLLVAFAPVLYLSESRGLLHLQYSKFADNGSAWSVPARLGMLLFYLPAGIAPAFVVGPARSHRAAAALMIAHYTKRCLECLFLHKFSGRTNLWTIAFVGGGYTLSSVILTSTAPAEGSAAVAHLGLLVWLVGQLGNFYHHWLLANLRKPGDMRHVVPRGGLFAYVASPHYLFEIVSWVGAALSISTWYAWAMVWFSSWYLAGRATATLDWYAKKGMRTPPGWKRLVPLVF